MIAVIFEVFPARGQKSTYMDIAADLKNELQKIDGFISVERYQSLSDPDKILSLSFFRDEEAVKSWRTSFIHRSAQAAGRSGVFANYRLRVADVTRDYGLNNRDQAPQDSRNFHHERELA